MTRPPNDGPLPPEFLDALRADSAAAAREWTNVVGDGVFQLPEFDAGWCAAFLDRYDRRMAELGRLGRRPGPPNSMHDGGAALADLGWGELFDDALATWLRPLAAELFPEVGGARLDSVYGFVVDYGPEGDEMLGYHADDAAVTLNLCLGGEFDGSELYFRGRRCARHRQTYWAPDEEFEYRHRPGFAILHAGAHRHGVRWLDEGRRRNLILWLHGSALRASSAGDDEPCPAWCDWARGAR
jgi:hypothetical protein